MHPEDTNINFQYLYPPLNSFSIIHKPDYIKHGKKKKIVRKIFHFVDYDEYENEKIKELQTAIHDEKIVLPPNWLESDTLKYCYAGKFKMTNCIKQLKKHLEWRNNDKYQILSEGSLELLKEGVIYIHGRDRLNRPIIVFDVHKINLKRHKIDSLIGGFSYVLTTVYKNMFVPGLIENWIIIIDINNMSIMHVPFKMLHLIIDCMSNNYVSTVERLFITNPSSSLNLMWKIIEAMMDPETVQKIRFLKKANFHEIQDFVDPNQIQKKYGGTLEDPTEFWPPKSLIDIRKDIPIIEKKIQSIRSRLVTGCQTTNCLPEKQIKENNNNIDIGRKNQDDHLNIKDRKYEPELNSPLSDQFRDDIPKKDITENTVKFEENMSLIQINKEKNKPLSTLFETNSTLSLKNEGPVEYSSETIVLKNNNGHQNLNKFAHYEIISEKNEVEEKEIELEENNTKNSKRIEESNVQSHIEPVLEKEEKATKCQACNECSIF